MYLPRFELKKVIKIIKEMRKDEGDAALILLAEKDKPDIDQMISELNKEKINFFGGIFPGIIYNDKKYEEGAIVTVLSIVAKPYLIEGLSSGKIEFPDFEEELMKNLDKEYTTIVLVDGLTANISLFLVELFNQLGNSVHYFGGGAGSLTLKPMPCLFTSEGFVQDAAIVTFSKLESKLGVRHGWKKIEGPLVVTKAYKNVVCELNWENALQVYQKIIESDSGEKLDLKNFYSLAMKYPFGMFKEGSEDVVRDPIIANEKEELICVGEVPQNSIVNILKGENESLIQAAEQAASDCLKIEGNKIRHCLIADCISRVLFLGEDFEKELASVKISLSSLNNQIIPEGMLTLGEISSYGTGFLEFFNKTIVVGVLYE